MSLKRILCAAAALGVPALAFAQQAPALPDAGAVQQRSLEALDAYRTGGADAGIAPTVVEFEAEEIAALRAAGDRATAPRFFIADIVADSSAILDAEDVDAALAPYEGREGTLFDLLDAAEAINALYRARGYNTARAILPPQDSPDGVFWIRLVEAQLEEVAISGFRHTDAEFVRNRLPSLQEGELVDVPGLERDLARFNVTNDVRASAMVEPGASQGGSRVVIQGQEPLNWDLTIQGDNAGRETVGRERGVVILRHASLTGRRDALTVGGTIAEGTTSGFLSYSVPVGVRGGRLSASYAEDYIEVIAGQFAPLDAEGDARDVRLDYTRPLVVSPGAFLGLRTQARWTESSSTFGGANLLTNTVYAVAAGLEFDRAARGGRWAGSALLTYADAETVGSTDVFRLNLDLLRVQPAPLGTALVLRGRGQLSSQDLLPGSEQFQLGGAASVRGYEEGVYIDDEGYLLSAEWQFSLDGRRALESPTRGFVFVDHGGIPDIIQDENLPARQDSYLTSAGVGLVHESDVFSLGATLGFPFEEQGADYMSPRLHLRLAVRPLAFGR